MINYSHLIEIVIKHFFKGTVRFLHDPVTYTGIEFSYSIILVYDVYKYHFFQNSPVLSTRKKVVNLFSSTEPPVLNTYEYV